MVCGWMDTVHGEPREGRGQEGLWRGPPGGRPAGQRNMSRILLSGGPEPQGAERHWKPPSLGAGCTPGVRVWFLPKQYPSQRPCPPAPEAACDCPACIFALGAGISNPASQQPQGRGGADFSRTRPGATARARASGWGSPCPFHLTPPPGGLRRQECGGSHDAVTRPVGPCPLAGPGALDPGSPADLGEVPQPLCGPGHVLALLQSGHAGPAVVHQALGVGQEGGGAQGAQLQQPLCAVPHQLREDRGQGPGVRERRGFPTSPLTTASLGGQAQGRTESPAGMPSRRPCSPGPIPSPKIPLAGPP